MNNQKMELRAKKLREVTRSMEAVTVLLCQEPGYMAGHRVIASVMDSQGVQLTTVLQALGCLVELGHVISLKDPDTTLVTLNSFKYDK